MLNVLKHNSKYMKNWQLMPTVLVRVYFSLSKKINDVTPVFDETPQGSVLLRVHLEAEIYYIHSFIHNNV